MKLDDYRMSDNVGDQRGQSFGGGGMGGGMFGLLFGRDPPRPGFRGGGGMRLELVTPAKAGVSWRRAVTSCPEIPAFAGMTVNV